MVTKKIQLIFCSTELYCSIKRTALKQTLKNFWICHTFNFI